MHSSASSPDPQPPLCPSQIRTLGNLHHAASSSCVTVLFGDPGSGKTVILKALHDEIGGLYLTAVDGLEALFRGNPEAMEESLIGFLTDAFSDQDTVIFDDEGMFEALGSGNSERPYYLVHALTSFADRLARAGKRLIAGAGVIQPMHDARGAIVTVAPLALDDYDAILSHRLGVRLPVEDLDPIFRAYRRLTAAQLVFVADLVAGTPKEALQKAILDVLDEYVSLGNVDVEEVEAVSLENLVGVADIVNELQRTVLIPMTQPELAKTLGLKPKRGVLLYGPPGTGKTTIGRALAHSMKGKFLMIDGTFIPGDTGFRGAVETVLKAAELNSPAVIFIDDADVIFQNGEMSGLARKLLSHLDGMKSEVRSNVCIVMTAMDISDMPAALVRSGRVEVWLEMRLPNAEQRWEIIQVYAKGLETALEGADRGLVAAATEGFTPADLRGLVGDARGHMAYDRHKGRVGQTLEHYLLIAAADIQSRKRRLGGGPPARRAA